MLRSLQHIALAVPDLSAGRDFFSRMGLKPRAAAGGLAFRCPGRAQDQVRLIPGARKGIAYVGFGARAADLKAIGRKLAARGIATEKPAPGGDRRALWFRDPDGDLLQVRAAADAPQRRPPVAINNPGQFRRRGKRGAPDRRIEAVPRRLGHVLKFSTDVPRAAAFYTEILGMKVSDWIGDKVAFLRFGGDSDHHTLALAHSEAPGLHHMSFEMGNIDQIQFCAQRLIEAGYKDAWGFGRHIYGSNYFHYVRDPWNGLVEFFWDIDFVPGDATWPTEVAEAGPDSLYQWATSPPPEDFLVNYERRA